MALYDFLAFMPGEVISESLQLSFHVPMYDLHKYYISLSVLHILVCAARPCPRCTSSRQNDVGERDTLMCLGNTLSTMSSTVAVRHIQVITIQTYGSGTCGPTGIQNVCPENWAVFIRDASSGWSRDICRTAFSSLRGLDLSIGLLNNWKDRQLNLHSQFTWRGHWSPRNSTTVYAVCCHLICEYYTLHSYWCYITQWYWYLTTGHPTKSLPKLIDCLLKLTDRLLEITTQFYEQRTLFTT